MSDRIIRVGPEMFRFVSMVHWISKARSWFEVAGVNREDFICIDTSGRVCRYGAHFQRAKEEGTFPIIVYQLEEDGEGA